MDFLEFGFAIALFNGADDPLGKLLHLALKEFERLYHTPGAPLEYLGKFIKGAKISSNVSINFSDNHPMRVNFPTGNVMLSFILAPRIEQE